MPSSAELLSQLTLQPALDISAILVILPTVNSHLTLTELVFVLLNALDLLLKMIAKTVPLIAPTKLLNVFPRLLIVNYITKIKQHAPIIIMHVSFLLLNAHQMTI